MLWVLQGLESRLVVVSPIGFRQAGDVALDLLPVVGQDRQHGSRAADAIEVDHRRALVLQAAASQ